jgi:hypothetical protein
VTSIFTDAANLQEDITEMKTKIGDCEIQTTIAKRKNELGNFISKLDRMNTEFRNLKKTCSGDQEDDIKAKMDEVEKKLNQFNNEKSLHESFLLNELEAAKPIDFVDFTKNHVTVKKVRALKNMIQESELHIADLEKI